MSFSRRHFVRMSAAAAMGFGGLHSMFSARANQTPNSASIVEGYGPIMPDPEGIFDLPSGFRYRVISTKGGLMRDGFYVPGKPDGMATFPGADGRMILIRNHEEDVDPESGPFGKANETLGKLSAANCYDPGSGIMPGQGGTTTILFNTETQEVEDEFLSLAGTIRNCAGGPTPWNSWVTCEETVQRAEGDLEKDHGYNFEVPASATSPVDAVALTEMGRFNHEAIAVDPASGAVYETEDRGDGLIYRYLPNAPGELAKGGTLQALAIREKPGIDTRNWDDPSLMMLGVTHEVEWIDMDDVESPEDDLRYRGHKKGAAVFARGEGMWYGDGHIYFACTNGGHAKKGQIWKYTPSPVEGKGGEKENPGRLELFVEPNDGGLIDNADNLTFAPWGDLIVCEDGSGEQFLVGVTQKGEIYKFARNAVSDSELAGATFSPDGTTLFVNIQHDGLTLAITGPWDRRVV